MNRHESLHESLMEKYKLLVISPTYKSGDNCNLTQTIENYLESKHPGHPEIGQVADMVTKRTCTKDCRICML